MPGTMGACGEIPTRGGDKTGSGGEIHWKTSRKGGHGGGGRVQEMQTRGKGRTVRGTMATKKRTKLVSGFKKGGKRLRGGNAKKKGRRNAHIRGGGGGGELWGRPRGKRKKKKNCGSKLKKGEEWSN